jgi:hypothetical protein
MDFGTQLITGILCFCIGLLIFVEGYRAVILRKAELVLAARFQFWLTRVIMGESVAEKYKSRFMKPKFLLYHGISNLIIGAITFVLGTLLLFL